MAYGLTIFNSNGFVLLDDTYTRYTVIQSGTGTTSGSAINFPAQTELPIILVRPPYLRWVQVVPPFPTLSSFSVIKAFSDSGAHFSFDYLVMKRVDTLPVQSGHGLNVYNSAGSPIFSSTLPMATLDLSAVWTIGAEVTYSVPPPPVGVRYLSVGGMVQCGRPYKANYLTREDICACINSETSVSVRRGYWESYVGFEMGGIYFSSDGKSFNFVSGYY